MQLRILLPRPTWTSKTSSSPPARAWWNMCRLSRRKPYAVGLSKNSTVSEERLMNEYDSGSDKPFEVDGIKQVGIATGYPTLRSIPR